MSKIDHLHVVSDVELIQSPLQNSANSDVIVDAETAMPSADPCKNCGSPVDEGDRFCHVCGSEIQIDDGAQTATDRKKLECKSCGSIIGVDKQKRSYTCPFCSSTYVVDFPSVQSGRQEPEFIIGFAVPQNQAIEKFHHWINSNRWYHPGDLKQAELTDRIQGIYLPFWSFSMLADSQWSASIGEYWYRTETYQTRDSNGKMVTRTRQVRETEWWDSQGDYHRYHSGYLISASHSLDRSVAEHVMPFDLPAFKRYEPYFLAGWASEEYTVERQEALTVSKQFFYDRETKNIIKFLPGNTHRNLQVTTDFSQVNSDLVLLPYFLLCYRYKENLYRFLINGQTGKVWGDKPLSKRKIVALIGGLVILLIIIILLGILFSILFS